MMLLISKGFLHDELVLSVNSSHHTQHSLTSIFKGVTPKLRWIRGVTHLYVLLAAELAVNVDNMERILIFKVLFYFGITAKGL